MEAECGGIGSGLVQVEIQVDNKTVGEFAGRKDKNGVEVYEGDIVNRKDTGNFRVIFRQEYCSFELESILRPKIYRLICERAVEVIGNDYENPELSKKD